MHKPFKIICIIASCLFLSAVTGLAQSIVINRVSPPSETAFAPDTVTINYTVDAPQIPLRFLIDGKEIKEGFGNGTQDWTTTIDLPGTHSIEVANADFPNERAQVTYNVPARFSIFAISWSYFRSAAAAGFSCTMGGIDPPNRASLDSAEVSGFPIIFAQIPRNDVSRSDWPAIEKEIAWAKSQHWGNNRRVKWLYLDDGQDHNGIDADSISVRQIDSLGHLAHINGLQLASSSWDVKEMKAEPAWWDSVDVIFPYDYTGSTSIYESFLRKVHNLFPNKGMVPGLGYHAAVNVTRPAWNWNYTHYGFYDPQLGDSAGHKGFIEIAEKYANEGIISYYISCENWDKTWPAALKGLTDYLQSYYLLKTRVRTGSTSRR